MTTMEQRGSEQQHKLVGALTVQLACGVWGKFTANFSPWALYIVSAF